MIKSLSKNLGLFSIVYLLISFSIFSSENSIDESLSLRDAVTVSAIRTHQKALQQVAEQNGGNRVSGSRGYDLSVSYIKKMLDDAGYRTVLQDFPLTLSKDKTTPKLTVTSLENVFQAGVDFANMIAMGTASITAEVEAVDSRFRRKKAIPPVAAN